MFYNEIIGAPICHLITDRVLATKRVRDESRLEALSCVCNLYNYIVVSRLFSKYV